MNETEALLATQSGLESNEGGQDPNPFVQSGDRPSNDPKIGYSVGFSDETQI